MNGAAKGSTGSGCNFSQAMVDQRPKFDNQVYSKRLKIHRPRKRKKPKFL